MCYGVAFLLAQWGPPCEYEDTLKRAKDLEEILQSLRLVYKGLAFWKAVTEIAWPLLCGVRNESEAEMVAMKKLVCMNE